ncbi:MAG TPA: hypothetical protein VNS63_22435 [Blastocatellia bacterium]|nr:hypothetical protein [Blastocatellia bacterium]
MRTQRRLISSAICALALLSNGAVVGIAQEKGAQAQHDFVFQRHMVEAGAAGWQDEHMGIPFEMMVPPGGPDTFMFVSSEMSLEKMVKGAPYSAQVVTEHTQTLQDGNRIVHKSTASVFRDSEGRTRREQTINAVGAYTASGTPKQTLFINDPVANVNYILDSDSKTARKIDLSRLPRSGFSTGVGGERRIEIVTGDKASGGGPGNVTITHSGATAGAKMKVEADAKNVKSESLGKQTIEGVVADGTRRTRTISAGEIGNEQPIYIVSESWYSADLQTVVMSKHSDPRFGESSYRLTNINRSEPAASLFQVPSDYTVKEAMPPGMRFKLDSEMRRPKSDQ